MTDNRIADSIARSCRLSVLDYCDAISKMIRRIIAYKISQLYQFIGTGTLSRDAILIPDEDEKVIDFTSFLFWLQKRIDGETEKGCNFAFLLAVKERSNPDVTTEQFLNMIDFANGKDRE
jgi:hypothetical protein